MISHADPFRIRDPNNTLSWKLVKRGVIHSKFFAVISDYFRSMCCVFITLFTHSGRTTLVNESSPKCITDVMSRKYIFTFKPWIICFDTIDLAYITTKTRWLISSWYRGCYSDSIDEVYISTKYQGILCLVVVLHVRRVFKQYAS